MSVLIKKHWHFLFKWERDIIIKSKKIFMISFVSFLSVSCLCGCDMFRKDSTITDKKIAKIKSVENENISVKQYTGLKVEVDSSPEITDDMVTDEANYYLDELDLHKKNYDDQIENGDFVNIQFIGKIDNAPFNGGSSESYDVLIGSNTMIDNFEQQLIGHYPGDTFTVSVTFPDNYSKTDLAGKDATFETTINYKKESIEIPIELTNDFIKENTEFDSLEEFYDYLRDDLEQQNLSMLQTNKENAVIDKLMNLSVVKNYPNDLLNSEINSLNKSYEDYASESGLDFDSLINQLGYNSRDDYDKHIMNYAKESVKYYLICNAIATEEDLFVSNDDYIEEGDKLSKEYGYSSVSEMENDYSKEEIKETLLDRKVVSFVIDNSDFIYDES